MNDSRTKKIQGGAKYNYDKGANARGLPKISAAMIACLNPEGDWNKVVSKRDFNVSGEALGVGIICETSPTSLCLTERVSLIEDVAILGTRSIGRIGERLGGVRKGFGSERVG